MKKSLNALFFILILFVLSSCSEKKQNVVFILVDDLGWTDLGYTGSTFYETPNIDKLSTESIVYTDAYASASICSPSRAAILTGQHPARLNITDWIPGDHPKKRKLIGPEDLSELPISEITLADIFRDNGYKTFFAGKWHLGDEGFFPEDQGFDINKGGVAKGQPPAGYYSPYKNQRLRDGPEGEYLTDRLTNESLNFIDDSKDEPFFLFLSYYTVHTPIQANKRHLKKFEEKLKVLDSNPDARRIEGDGLTTLEQRNPAYASMLYSLDENIGKLISKLKASGLYDNTTIVFTSDNGGLSTLMKQYKRPAPTSVLPLRAGKGWLYEGGIRVPLLIKPAHYSKENIKKSVPVVGHDFFPTLLSQVGLNDYDKSKIDGQNLSSTFLENDELKREDIFWHYPHYHGSAWTPGAAIRQGNWKLIEFYEDNRVELYNLKNDISELNDLSKENPKIVTSLRKKLMQRQAMMKAKPALQNPNFLLPSE